MPQARILQRLLHDAVHGGGQRSGLVDGLVLVQLEPGLPVVRPGRLYYFYNKWQQYMPANSFTHILYTIQHTVYSTI
jgi:hypothetical protein